MIIKDFPNSEDFFLKSCVIANTNCVLITPKISARWTPENLIFRSSIWTEKGELVSASFKKFFNWEEQPELTPKVDFHNSAFIEKIDGSTLIVSRYKGELIIRTRGTVDARQMDNGDEIDYLIKKYPDAFTVSNQNVTQIYEWVSPANQIVLKYPEPDIYLIGAVNHEDYSYFTQKELDSVSKFIGVKRPQIFEFQSPEHLFQIVSNFENQEGVCVYFNKGQDIRKVKSSKYLALHALKNMMDSDKAIIDLFLEWNCPNFTDFMAELERQYDYEIAQFILPQVSKISNAYQEYSKMIAHMQTFVDNIRDLPTRREQALIIIGAYGQTGKSGIAFSLLDGKEIEQRKIRQILLQMMAKI